MSDVHPVNFGALLPLPAGYTVAYYESFEHYMATGPGDWESAITVNRFDARRWCFDHAERQRRK